LSNLRVERGKELADEGAAETAEHAALFFCGRVKLIVGSFAQNFWRKPMTLWETTSNSIQPVMVQVGSDDIRIRIRIIPRSALLRL